jgi:hypothetical protein
MNGLSKMQMIIAAVVALLVLGILFGDDDTTDAAPTPTAVAPAPAPAPAPEPAPAPAPEPAGPPMDLGDDPELDALWYACAADDYDACLDLFWDSPLGSEYEAFADERLVELDAAAIDEMTDRDLIDEIGADVLLDLTWNGMSQDERVELCLGVGLLGAQAAGEIVSEGADGLVTPAEAAAWLDRKCS